MRAGFKEFWARLKDPSADKIVPPTGATAQLTVFVAGAMAFMCVFALAISFAANELAGRWSDALRGIATIEVVTGDSADFQRVFSVLEATPGVENVREVSEERQRALLAPWFGPDFPVETLTLPRLIELRESSGFDRADLVTRLEVDAPGARYLAPDGWQAKVASTARTIGLAAWGLILLTGAVMAALIMLAATTSLMAQASIIETLRLVGAEDAFIATAFVRRFTLRCLIGAAIGTGTGALFLMIFSGGQDSLLGLLRPGAWGWVTLTLIPPFAAAIGFGATSVAARRILARIL